jgi:hypothetical protein
LPHLTLRTTGIVLSLAVAIGVVLALWHMHASDNKPGPPWPLGILHGALGIAGLLALILLLQGPRRGDAMGAGSFGTTAAVLFAIALAAGVTIPLLIRRFPRSTAVSIALHAGLAITGYVLFLAWASMG